MKTAEDAINMIRDLQPGEFWKVVDYIESAKETELQHTYCTPEQMTILDQRDDDIKNGVNVEEFSSMREARISLGLMEKDANQIS